ncbi:MAG: NAD-dependent epimerase/dehydratase family protein [Bdellovibrionota bacterium]
MLLTGKTLAITGVGGFIGLRMAELARERGMKVKGMDLSPQAAKKAEALGVQVILGNVTDPKAAQKLCEGADIVFHTAAIVSESDDWENIRKVNVGGTKVMAEAASRAGCSRLVHLSSVMVYGFDFPKYVTEEGPFRGENNPYCQTKIESEEEVLKFHKKNGLEVIIIRPGDVYGPGSLPWVVRPLQMMKRGMFALIDSGKGVMNHVYVDNLLDAVFLALEKDATGEAFNVTDGLATSWKDYWETLARIGGAPKLRSVPSWAMRPALSLGERIFKLLGREPPGNPAAIGFLTRPHPYSIDKARKILGYSPKISLEEGMRRTGEWLRGK